MKRSFIAASLVVVSALGCASKPVVAVEEYKYSARQIPPAPVYSRTTWAHTPDGPALPSKENAPLLQPVIAFRQNHSNVGEAIQGLARTLGYRAEVPASLAGREVDLNVTGTFEQVSAALARQASVRAVVDSDARVVRVEDVSPSATLPAAAQ